MRGLAVSVVGATLLAACGAGSQHHSAGPQGRTAGTVNTSALAAGRQGGRADVPWAEVGANWFLATWSNAPAADPAAPAGKPTTTGTDTLFLVDPAGGRYALETFAHDSRHLVAWSGDGQRALFVGPPSGTSSPVTVEALRSGAMTTVDTVAAAGGLTLSEPSIIGEAFTEPKGQGLLLTYMDVVGHGEALVRTDLSGDPQATMSLPGAGEVDAVDSPDGTKVYVGNEDPTGTVLVYSGAGAGLAALPGPTTASDCRPVRFLDPATLLADCLTGDGAQLWKLPVDGSAATALTSARRSPADVGDYTAYAIGGKTYVEVNGAPGGSFTYVASLGADGQTTALVVPGAGGRHDSQLIIGTDGTRRLAISAVCCSGGVSLFWYDPATAAEEILLGPGANGGGVLNALEFPGH